jgi:SecD/SecF fusion protein
VARSRTSTSALVRGVAALLVLAFSFYVALTQTASLGLDLSGGTQIVIQTQDTGRVEANAENTDKALEVLRQRVNQLGVNESTLARSGENRIIVELPGVQNPDEAAELIGSTAQLSFHEVLGFGELPLSGQGPLVPTETPEVSAPDDGGAAGGGAEGEGPEGGAGEGEGAEGEGPGGGAGEGDGAPPGGAGGEEQKRRVAPSLVSADGDQPTDDQPPADEQTTDPPADEQPAPEAPAAEEPALVLPDESGAGLQLAPASLTGEDVTGADAELTQQGVAEWVVNVTFNGEGGGRWQQITSKAACARVEDESDGRDDSPTDRVAIVLDDQIISSPTVQSGCPEGIPGGSTQITGNFNQESATDLAVLIEGGALPLDVEIIEQRTVGPTLGQDAIDASIRAALIGLALTGLFICFVYRLMGFLATLALASYTLMAYALLVAVGATLTLPGLAGFVLAIGMAIDANVLVFERAREEYARRRGEGLEPALETGYRKALSAILDSNITTLLAAVLPGRRAGAGLRRHAQHRCPRLDGLCPGGRPLLHRLGHPARHRQRAPQHHRARRQRPAANLVADLRTGHHEARTPVGGDVGGDHPRCHSRGPDPRPQPGGRVHRWSDPGVQHESGRERRRCPDRSRRRRLPDRGGADVRAGGRRVHHREDR